MPLIDRIVAEYPVRLDLTDLAAAACEQFESFAGLTEKLPKPLEGTNIQNILEFGWPLAIVGANPSFEWLRNRVTKEIARTGHASRSDWAVIHAGALLTAVGARVTFLREVKKQGTRTPDIRASFDDQVIDFEGTYPKIRRRSRELHQLITEVNLEVDKIYRGEPYYLFVYIGEVELTSVGAEIIDAIRALPGKSQHGSVNRWYVVAMSRDEAKAVPPSGAIEGVPPNWWPDQKVPRLDTSAGSPSGQAIFPTFFRVQSYLDPIVRKANRPQRDAGIPFVIMIDATADIVPHEQLSTGLLENWFPLWPNVAGVLIFDRRPFFLGNFCWKTSLHLNSHATIQASSLARLKAEDLMCKTMNRR